MTKSIPSRKALPATTAAAKKGPRVASKKLFATVAPKNAADVRPTSNKAQPTGKIALITGLLRRSEGASIANLMKATGWQAHSVRGAISGVIKKKLGLEVISEKKGAARIYRTADRTAA